MFQKRALLLLEKMQWNKSRCIRSMQLWQTRIACCDPDYFWDSIDSTVYNWEWFFAYCRRGKIIEFMKTVFFYMFKLNKKEETKNSEFCQKDSIEFSQKSLDASWRGKALSSSLKCELFADFFLLLYIARAHIQY